MRAIHAGIIKTVPFNTCLRSLGAWNSSYWVKVS